MAANEKSGSPFLYDDNDKIIGVKDPDGGEYFFPRFATQALAAARAASDATFAASDLLWLTGDGAPVDYTDGDPAATGEGAAGKGSLYTDYTNGKLYVNGGTKAEPAWKIFTSA
jgi:hypothetical protein